MKIDGYEFPDVSMNGMGIARYYSVTNPWIDVLAIVFPKNAVRATEIMDNAMDAWWDDDKGQCYGDVIGDALDVAGIPHHLIFHDSDDESQEYEDAWDKYTDGLYAAMQGRQPTSEF